MTTHYIEEARNSHTIGLLHRGHLLAEEDPNVLLRNFCSDSLEKVFLLLCQQNEKKEDGFYEDNDVDDYYRQLPEAEDQTSLVYSKYSGPHHRNLSWKRIEGVTLALLFYGRSIKWSLLLALLLPSLQVLLVHWTGLGSDFNGVQVAVSNEDHLGNNSFAHGFIEELRKRKLVLVSYLESRSIFQHSLSIFSDPIPE